MEDSQSLLQTGDNQPEKAVESVVAEQLIPQKHGGALRPAFKSGAEWRGNSLGRKSAGAAIGDWYTLFSDRMDAGKITADELRDIARNDPNGNRRVAAKQWIEAFGADIADFEPLLQGKKSAGELRAAGVNTSMVKKATVRSTIDKDGGVSKQITLELRHGGEALDRIADRTEGKPTQRLEVAKVERDPSSVMQDIAALLAASPELRTDLALIYTTAEVLPLLCVDQSHRSLDRLE